MTYLISLIILLLPTYLVRFSVFGVPSTALEVLIYVVFLVGLYQAKKQSFRRISWQIWVPVTVLAIAAIISTFISPLRHEALGELKAFFIDPIMVVWLMYQFIKKEDFPKIIWAFALSGLFVSIHAIVQRLTGNLTVDGRVVGIFGYSPNYLALYLSPIAILMAGESLTLQKKKHFLKFSLWPELFFLVMLLGIYLSGSRGGLLAVAAGLGAFAIFHYWGWIYQRFSAKIIIGILILAAFYTSWTLFKPNFNLAGPAGGRVVTSNNVRWQIWETSLEMIKSHPVLGVGLANYQNAFAELTKNRINFPEYITPVALSSHNVFLMFYLTTGLLGILAFLGLIVIFFRNLFRAKSSYVPYLGAAMAAILIYGLIDTPYFKNDLSVMFWVVWVSSWIL